MNHCFHSTYAHDVYNKIPKFCTLYPVKNALLPALEEIYFSSCPYKGIEKETKLVMGDIYDDDEGW